MAHALEYSHIHAYLHMYMHACIPTHAQYSHKFTHTCTLQRDRQWIRKNLAMVLGLPDPNGTYVGIETEEGEVIDEDEKDYALLTKAKLHVPFLSSVSNALV
jgi:hypothetical protein